MPGSRKAYTIGPLVIMAASKRKNTAHRSSERFSSQQWAFRIQKRKHPVKTRSPGARGAARTQAPRVPPDDQTQKRDPQGQRHVRSHERRQPGSEQVQRKRRRRQRAAPAGPDHFARVPEQRDEHQRSDERRKPPGQVPLAAGEIIQSGGGPSEERRLGGDGFAARGVLKSPMSRLDHFQRRESLLGLIVFVQPPWEIAQDEQSDDQP